MSYIYSIFTAQLHFGYRLLFWSLQNFCIFYSFFRFMFLTFVIEMLQIFYKSLCLQFQMLLKLLQSIHAICHLQSLDLFDEEVGWPWGFDKKGDQGIFTRKPQSSKYIGCWHRTVRNEDDIRVLGKINIFKELMFIIWSEWCCRDMNMWHTRIWKYYQKWDMETFWFALIESRFQDTCILEGQRESIKS